MGIARPSLTSTSTCIYKRESTACTVFRTKFLCDRLAREVWCKVVMLDIYRGESCAGKPMTPEFLIPFVKQFTSQIVSKGSIFSHPDFNSRTAIAGAIIGLRLVFLQFKEFELYWGAVFLRLEEEYWRSPFF